MTHDPSSDELNRLAARRAGLKMGFFVHAAAYLVVNLGLLLLSLSQGAHWAVYPALGWGLGLLLHGAVTWLALPGGGLNQRLLERERQYLDSQRK